MDARTHYDAAAELGNLVNLQGGWLDRRIFWEEWVYQLELERLFARSWLFVAQDFSRSMEVVKERASVPAVEMTG